MSLARANEIVSQVRTVVPWLPQVPVEADPTNGGRAFYTYDGTSQKILIPGTYEPGDAILTYVVTHECGHAAQDFLGLSGWDAVEAEKAMLAFHKADPALINHSLRSEIWAETWTRAQIPSYDGWAYPRLFPLITMRPDSLDFFKDPRRYAVQTVE